MIRIIIAADENLTAEISILDERDEHEEAVLGDRGVRTRPHDSKHDAVDRDDHDAAVGELINQHVGQPPSTSGNEDPIERTVAGQPEDSLLGETDLGRVVRVLREGGTRRLDQVRLPFHPDHPATGTDERRQKRCRPTRTGTDIEDELPGLRIKQHQHDGHRAGLRVRLPVADRDGGVYRGLAAGIGRQKVLPPDLLHRTGDRALDVSHGPNLPRVSAVRTQQQDSSTLTATVEGAALRSLRQAMDEESA